MFFALSGSLKFAQQTHILNITFLTLTPHIEASFLLLVMLLMLLLATTKCLRFIKENEKVINKVLKRQLFTILFSNEKFTAVFLTTNAGAESCAFAVRLAHVGASERENLCVISKHKKRSSSLIFRYLN